MSQEIDKAKAKRLLDLLLDLYENKKLTVLTITNKYADISSVVRNLLIKGYIEKVEEDEQIFYRLTKKGTDFIEELIQKVKEKEEQEQKQEE